MKDTTGPRISPRNISRYRYEGDDVAKDIADKYGYTGDLAAIFTNPDKRLVSKWHHYIPLYDRYFAPWRGKPVRFLELGVFRGGSLAMWREYFGPEATIYGIDIEPKCAAYDGEHGQVRIGSQDDPDFLRGVVEEMGGVDLVLDDGSHVMDHIRVSLQTLYPLLSDGGTYMIEDLHTAYWKKFGGGYRQKRNVFHDLMRMVDDIHSPYHGHEETYPAISGSLTGVHMHDSIAVLEKGGRFAPVFSKVGRRG